ncbi:MAG: branched-chain amino acid ABC transporter permease [Candidatus Pacebacteria bacterium]|nr:branched-chain amino acid ABC transporter permease [Candidatus Paceibacterota bacterium]MDD5357236.1 branched-chain amino acid ABC transporter permease [Candidatus Paceibacterota bacterium]
MSIVPQLVLNSIIAGSIYSLMALGFSLIFSTVKFFDLSYGVLATAGAYGTFYVLKTLGLPLFVAVPAGILISALLGFLFYKLIYRKLRARKSSNTVMLVASLGVFTALQAVVAILFTSQFQTLSSNLGQERVFIILSGAITQTQVIILCTSILVAVGLALLLKFTFFGKMVRAVGDDEEVSKIVGVNTEKIIGGIFIIGSAIAGLAGIMVGFDTGIEPTMGLPLLLKAVIASIIGGMGNIYGALLGAFLLGFVENFGIWHISGEWKDAIAFGVLIIFLIFKPQGIFKQ